MPSLNDQLRAELQSREATGLRRALKIIPPDVIDLASNDYLGLSQHPAVVSAACEAARTYGTGARASRLVGSALLHEQLEAAIARFKGCSAALVLPSGYQVNLAVIAALASAETMVFCDKRNHASLIDGCRFARAGGANVRFYHSLGKLRAMLDKSASASRRLIITDAVFSMDGDLADLPQLAEMAETFDAVLILDDAHGTGVLGDNGHGTAEHYGLSGQSDHLIHLGTLSKAIGAQGGFVAGSREFIDWLINAARPFIYSTGLNPASCGAALAAFEILGREPERLSRLREVTERLANGLQDLGFDARRQPSPIIPAMVGEVKQAVALSEALLVQGVWCPAIRPPTVPPGTSRLRVTASATLTDANIERALAAFAAARR